MNTPPSSPRNDRQPWTHEENLIAFNLYCKLPFGKLHHSNPSIVDLARLLGRSSNSIAMRLSNFASLDPSLQQRGIKGLTSYSKSVEQVWADFHQDPERVTFLSEELLAQRLGKQVEEVAEVVTSDLPEEGLEREAIVRVRVNQSLFRKRLISAYEYRCCITGIDILELLVASHIVPWSADKINRLNPRNGLCLNPLHDRAFDRGLIWIDQNFTVNASEKLRNGCSESKTFRNWLLAYDGVSLKLPRNFSPDERFLEWHKSNIVARAS